VLFVAVQHFFSVGAAKTGTTLLARMLDQQPAVASMSESYFFDPDHPASFFRLDNHVAGRHGFRPDKVEAWRSRALATVAAANGQTVRAIDEPSHGRSIISEILNQFAERNNARFVGDKWPYYHEHLDALLAAFPDGKFLYNVRDPRAVWNSGNTFRDRQLGPKVLSDLLVADQRLRPYADDSRFHVFRYEDLVTEPQETMTNIAEFIGFEFDPSAIEYDETKDRYSNRWNWVPTAKGELNQHLTEKWRHEMPIDAQRRVTERFAEFIEHYGYDPLES
jgi:hypothetical protein